MFDQPIFFGSGASEPNGIQLIYDSAGYVTSFTLDMGNEHPDRHLLIGSSCFSAGQYGSLAWYVNGVNAAPTYVVGGEANNRWDDGHSSRILFIPMPLGRTVTVSLNTRQVVACWRTIGARVFGTNGDGEPEGTPTKSYPLATAAGGFSILTYVNNFDGYQSLSGVDFNTGTSDARVAADYETATGTTTYLAKGSRISIVSGTSFDFKS